MTIEIGFPIFPDVTQLDFTGPFEVMSRIPGARCHILAETLDPVAAQGGVMVFVPTATLKASPQLDILCVPGGFGHIRAMENPAFLEFLAGHAASCRYVTSVCTGSLVLAAAGLLAGYRATTHWQSFHRLSAYGAIPTKGRVVIDRNRITGGGVTAGIDFGLTLAEVLAGPDIARQIATQVEYVPAPPLSGDPETCPAPIRAALEARVADYAKRIAEADARAIARLKAQGAL